MGRRGLAEQGRRPAGHVLVDGPLRLHEALVDTEQGARRAGAHIAARVQDGIARRRGDAVGTLDGIAPLGEGGDGRRQRGARHRWLLHRDGRGLHANALGEVFEEGELGRRHQIADVEQLLGLGRVSKGYGPDVPGVPGVPVVSVWRCGKRDGRQRGARRRDRSRLEFLHVVARIVECGRVMVVLMGDGGEESSGVHGCCI